MTIPAINIYSNPDEVTSPKWAEAFRSGLPAHITSEIRTDDDVRPGMHAGFGSPAYWQSFMACVKRRDDWFYGDHGYFGRKMFYRITKNAFQHDGVTGRPDFRKLRMFHQEAKPFLKEGRYVLVCLQSESFHERMGVPQAEYLHSIRSRLSLYTDREIVVRSKRTDKPFDLHMRDAWAVVTHSSACALHALMAGIPAFTTADNAVSSLTLRDPVNIERPYYPDTDLRFNVAGILAANQWNFDEIANGDAWRKLNETV